jgi:hypothetical protein
MRGLPDYNYPLFHETAAWLRNLEYDVVNPAELFGDDLTLDRSVYLREGIRALLDCDAIAMLPGWPDSPGAVLELTVASNLGLDLLEIAPNEQIRPLFAQV